MRVIRLVLVVVLCGLGPAAFGNEIDNAAGDAAPPFPHGGRELTYGSPSDAGLVGAYAEQISADLRLYLAPSPSHPMYAGGVVLAARHGVIAVHDAAGHAVRYADVDTELPPDQRVPATRDTIYDLASLTKMFTTIAVMQQVEAGRVVLDEPVATYLPAFAEHGKSDVTIRDLLTHTGGLPAWVPLYSRYGTVEERLAAVLAVEPTADPGARYVYSDLGLITLGLVVEEVTGRSLDAVITDGITGPLGMHETMFNPPARLHDRIAATEAQPWAGRPMLRGEVHDENAWSLGGVAGHAGLFSTAHDLAVLAQTLLNGGKYGDARILAEATLRAMLTDENTEFPGNAHGLGFELDQRWYMEAMSSPYTYGHTGFTGTSLVVDPMSDSFVVLLTNRVHPTRDWGSNNPSRRAVARDVARAVAVRPAHGATAWFSGLGDARTATLTVPISSPTSGPASVSFGLWYDTEAGDDIATLESSTDGGQTWQPVPFTLVSGDGATATDGSVSGFSGRRWHTAKAPIQLSPDGQLLRWRYQTDSLYQGRGVYVDAVRLEDADGRPLDGLGSFHPEGWVLSRN
ncbi:MAG: serine hydrolase [Nocardioidaceae bacterium]